MPGSESTGCGPRGLPEDSLPPRNHFAILFNTMRTFIGSVLVLSLVVASCGKMQGSSSIDVGRLADTWAELLVLNERYTLAKDTLSGQKYVTEYQSILRNHGLTKEEYTSQFETVVCNAAMYRDLCDRALKRLQTMRSGSDPMRGPGRS